LSPNVSVTDSGGYPSIGWEYQLDTDKKWRSFTPNSSFGVGDPKQIKFRATNGSGSVESAWVPITFPDRPTPPPPDPEPTP
jgi:hypothetical protein